MIDDEAARNERHAEKMKKRKAFQDRQVASKSVEKGLLMVSNEVGLGIVPDTALGREFRDTQGRLNQSIAAIVPRVVFIAAGLPLVLKGTL